MVQLFDFYTQKTADLHHSLLEAGVMEPTVVIHDTGFLPDTVLNPYRFFFDKETVSESHGCFFNQIVKPDLWEITATHTQAEVWYYQEKKATIYYAQPRYNRIVERVEWYDKDKTIRSIDFYDKKGTRYAQTVCDKAGNPITKTYYNVAQQEVIVENFVTGDVILNEDNRVRVFKTKALFLQYFFERANIDTTHILYNTLATSFAFSRSQQLDGSDILFWQEPIYEQLPGNMQLLLNQPHRTKKIIVQSKSVYQKIKMLVPETQHGLFDTLGYIYPFKKRNAGSQHVLILTNSDNIEQLQYIVERLSHAHIHIGAITEMSAKLLVYGTYDNVTLYPNMSPAKMIELYQLCDIYLDINHESEVSDAIRQAFDHNMVILAFEHTLHQEAWVANEHRFDQVDALVQYCQKLLVDRNCMTQAIVYQHTHAQVETVTTYQQILNKVGNGEHV